MASRFASLSATLLARMSRAVEPHSRAAASDISSPGSCSKRWLGVHNTSMGDTQCSCRYVVATRGKSPTTTVGATRILGPVSIESSQQIGPQGIGNQI